MYSGRINKRSGYEDIEGGHELCEGSRGVIVGLFVEVLGESFWFKGSQY